MGCSTSVPSAPGRDEELAGAAVEEAADEKGRNSERAASSIATRSPFISRMSSPYRCLITPEAGADAAPGVTENCTRHHPAAFGNASTSTSFPP